MVTSDFSECVTEKGMLASIVRVACGLCLSRHCLYGMYVHLVVEKFCMLQKSVSVHVNFSSLITASIESTLQVTSRRHLVYSFPKREFIIDQDALLVGAEQNIRLSHFFSFVAKNVAVAGKKRITVTLSIRLKCFY